MSATPIFKLVDELPENNLTTKPLHALDFFAPGQWRNLVGFENTIKVITGEADQALIQKIGERAIKLYNDRSQGYQRALWLYQTVRDGEQRDGLRRAGQQGRRELPHPLAAVEGHAQVRQGPVDRLRRQAGGRAGRLLPAQRAPGDSIGDFVKSLTHYRNEALIRMVALICFDGLLPLGPDFLSKLISLHQGAPGPSDLEQNETFKQVQSLVPGGETQKQLGFIQKSMSSVHDWMADFTTKHDLTPTTVLGKLQGFLDVTDNRLDYVAAFIDLTTNYYEHTGIQTVARSLIERAVNEI